MTADDRQLRVPGEAGRAERIVATARWDGERWAVSVPNEGSTGCANTFADTLAEVVPNAAEMIAVLIGSGPADLASRIDLKVHIDPELAIRYHDARDPHDAAATLRAAGLRRDDIDTIVLSRIFSVIASATHAGIPDDPRGSRG
jgi:hypothetical protein